MVQSMSSAARNPAHRTDEVVLCSTQNGKNAEMASGELR